MWQVSEVRCHTSKQAQSPYGRSTYGWYGLIPLSGSPLFFLKAIGPHSAELRFRFIQAASAQKRQHKRNAIHFPPGAMIFPMLPANC